jgi:2-dehydropantoate 2-reductase
VRVCVLGAGGLGSVFGGWLAESGADVTLVARAPHVEAIEREGLRITGLRGEQVVRDRLRAVVDPSDAEGEFDLLAVLVKAKDTTVALEQAEPLRDRVRAVCSFQNTVTKEDELTRWIGAGSVIGASTTEAGVLVAPGIVRHVATAPVSCYFGEVAGGSSARIEDVVAAFGAAGFAAKASDDIGHVEWEKLLQISIVAAWSVSTFGALGGSMAEGLAVREAAEHYVQLATELFAVYRALGYEPCDYFAPFSRFRTFATSTFEESVDEMMALGAQMRRDGMVGRPSLHDDLLRGRTTEVQWSLGAFLGAADDHAVAVPTARAAYRIIRSLEFWLVRTGGVRPAELPELSTVEDFIAERGGTSA